MFWCSYCSISRWFRLRRAVQLEQGVHLLKSWHASTTPTGCLLLFLPELSFAQSRVTKASSYCHVIDVFIVDARSVVDLAFSFAPCAYSFFFYHAQVNRRVASPPSPPSSWLLVLGFAACGTGREFFTSIHRRAYKQTQRCVTSPI